jgi:SH3-like domain-containing protein
MRAVLLAVPFIACGLASFAAHAEFRSIAEPAVLYDAPSARASRLYVASRNLPVEVISTDGAWVKVRDPFGGLSWIERKLLTEKRTALVTAAVADVRQRPEEGAPLAFQAQQGVVLELVEAGATGWARVRHADGASGWVRANQLWGI